MKKLDICKAVVAVVMSICMVLLLMPEKLNGRSSANEAATATDGIGVTGRTFKVSFKGVDEYGNMPESPRLKLAGVQYGVYRNRACTEEEGVFILSCDGVCYKSDEGIPVVYAADDGIPEDAEKYELELVCGTYFIKQLPDIYTVTHGQMVKTGESVNENIRDTEIKTVSVNGDMTLKIVIPENSSGDTVKATDTDAENIDSRLLFGNDGHVSVDEVMSEEIPTASLAASGVYIKASAFDGYYARFTSSSITYSDIWCNYPGRNATTGYYSVTEWNSDTVRKAMYYNYQNTYGEAWKGWSGDGTNIKTYTGKYRTMTAVMGYLNRGSYAGHTAVNVAGNSRSYLAWLNMQPDVDNNTSATLSLTADGEVKFGKINDSYYQYQKYKLSCSGNAMLQTVPTNAKVFVYNTTSKKWVRITSTTTKIKGGSKVIVAVSPATTGSTNVTFITRCAKAYYANPGGGWQSVCYGTRNRKTATVKTTWKRPTFQLKKVWSEDEKTPVKDAEYEIYTLTSKEPRTKVVICTMKTNSSGIGVVTKVGTNDLLKSCDIKTGATTIRYPLDYPIFIRETKAPTGYALSEQKSFTTWGGMSTKDAYSYEAVFRFENGEFTTIAVDGDFYGSTNYDSTYSSFSTVYKAMDEKKGKVKLRKTALDTNNNKVNSTYPMATHVTGSDGKTHSAGIYFVVRDKDNKAVAGFVTSYDGKCYADKKTGKRVVFANSSEMTGYANGYTEYAVTLDEGSYKVEEGRYLRYFVNGEISVASTAEGAKKNTTIANLGFSENSLYSDEFDMIDGGGIAVLDSENYTVSGSLKMSKYKITEEGISKKEPAEALFTVTYKGTDGKSNTKIADIKVNGENMSVSVAKNLTGSLKNVAEGGGDELYNLPIGTYVISEKTAYGFSSGETVTKTPDATLTVARDKQTLSYSEPNVTKDANGKTVLTWTKKSVSTDSLDTTITDCYDAAKTKYVAYNYYEVEEPELNNLSMNISKVDVEGTSHSVCRLPDAVIEVKYYRGLKEAARIATDTWYFKTDKSGNIKLTKEYLYSDDSHKNSAIPDTDENGRFQFDTGTIVLTEVIPPTGYLKAEDGGYIKTSSGEQVSDSNSMSIYLNKENSGIKFYFGNKAIDNEIIFADAPERGDVKFSKSKLNDDGSTSPMAGVVFKITNTETGEYHYAVTDENGEFSSAKTRANGASGLNRNCSLYEGDTESYTKDETNASYGVWFTAGGLDCEDITTDMMSVGNGSLTVGNYKIEEVRCKANEGYVLSSPREFEITEDGQTVDLTETDTFINVGYPTLTTKSDSFIKKGESVTLNDTVTMTNLKAETEYTLKGIIMDKETGRAVTDANGDTITSVHSFTTGKADAYGYVLKTEETVKFENIDSRSMKSTYVVFEYLFEGNSATGLTSDKNGLPETGGAMTDEKGNVVGHADIKNEDGSQTFTVSSISTHAFESETKEQHIMATGNLSISDTVSYEGLTIGEEYTLTARLAFVSGGSNARDGDGGYVAGALLGVSASKAFIPSEKNGEETVTFAPFDATPYEGCTVVVYEYLCDSEGNTVAAEEEVSNEDQQIYFIEIHTDSNDDFKPSEYLKRYDSDVTLTDKVSCTNLEVGRKYRVSGTLMTKDGETVTTGSGENVKGSTEFTATEKDMTVDVVFSYNPLDCGLVTATVAFETLYVDEKEVAAHADLSDDSQTNYYPTVTTKLLTEDSLRYITVSEDGKTTAKLSDEISYKNIPEGTVFTVVGKLINKATGKPISADGKEITATATYSSPAMNGSVYVNFPEFNLEEAGIMHKTDDGNYYDGIVAYEYLYAGDEVSEDSLVAKEEDINNEDQTISTVSLHTTAVDRDTQTNVVAVSEVSTLTDSVRYTGLTVGKEYTISGTLMCKETGKEITTGAGEKITASVTFTAEKSDGYAEVVFTYNPIDCGLVGKTVVAFEDLIPSEGDVYSHADIDDEDQTVYVPEIKTELTAKEGKTVSDADIISLTDKISINNLAAGNTYKAEVTLYDTVTKKPVTVNGKTITKTVSVPAETEKSEESAVSTTLDVTFDTFSGADAGIIAEDKSVHDLTAVSTLYVKKGDDWTVCFKHNEDLSDAAETVKIKNPRISTSFHLSGSESRVFNADDKKVALTDTVKYAGLEKGKTYELYAYVYNRNTGRTLRSGSEQICVVKKFTAQAGSGSVDVEFTLNPSELGILEEDGTCASIVCFENLYKDGVKIAEHASLTYEKQTVYPVPSGHTKAEDKASGTQSALPTGSVTIIDHISYANLIVGREYTVTGTLMDKESGKPLGIEGSSKTVKFKPEKTTGIYDMEFTIDASALVGKAIVVFEDVRYKNTEVFAHKDLSDEDQTITFPKVGTTATVGGGKKLVKGKVNTITDTIRYEKLDATSTYKITAKLIKKSDGSVVATSTKEFTPGGRSRFASGKTVMKLSLDVPEKQSGSARYVVYEYIYSENGTLIAKHEDINDEGQTVEITYVPQTGDMIRLGLLLGMFAAAVCGSVITVRAKRKRRAKS